MALVCKTKSWEEEEEDFPDDARKTPFRDHVFLGDMFLMGAVESTQNTGHTFEKLQEEQRQDWILEITLPSQLLRVVSYIFTAVW